jgi:hypothetical protein
VTALVVGYVGDDLLKHVAWVAILAVGAAPSRPRGTRPPSVDKWSGVDLIGPKSFGNSGERFRCCSRVIRSTLLAMPSRVVRRCLSRTSTISIDRVSGLMTRQSFGQRSISSTDSDTRDGNHDPTGSQSGRRKGCGDISPDASDGALPQAIAGWRMDAVGNSCNPHARAAISVAGCNQIQLPPIVVEATYDPAAPAGFFAGPKTIGTQRYRPNRRAADASSSPRGEHVA